VLPPTTSLAQLRARYSALLLDAYGVLVDEDGALPGAAEAVAALERDAVPWLVVTNDASRSEATNAARLRSLGLDVPPARILSSGALVTPWLREHGLGGARCTVLGSDEAVRFVARDGHEIVPVRADAVVDAIVLADDAGFPFLETMNAALSLLMRAFDAGRPPALLLANPDVIFPAAGGRYGFTAGAMAVMLESALALRFPELAPRFIPLGKPSPRIFDEAFARLGTRDAVMVGDQLHTDIAGAHAVRIASALCLTGVTSTDTVARSAVQPTYILPSIGA
jgi:HAD superfamily hydrolase (TIGR01450 family)